MRVSGTDHQWQIAILLYPGISRIDLVGFSLMLLGFASIHWVWKTREAVLSDQGTPIFPNATFDECPLNLDVLFVPPTSHRNAVGELDYLCFLADRILRAKCVVPLDFMQPKLFC